MVSMLGKRHAALLLTPACLLLCVFFLYPLGVVAWKSIYSDGFTLAAYASLFEGPLFAKVLSNTLRVSVIATVLSTIVGYCLAAHIARQNNARRLVFLTLVMVPLWTSVLVKSFSLTVMLGDQGLLNQVIVHFFGEQARMQLLFNGTGVIIGMINYLLPFTVFPILASLLAVDPLLARAARLMGAGPIRIFMRITLPLSLPGVMAATLMAMTLSLGMFVTPALLGGRQDMMMANLVDLYTRQIMDWEGAAAISMILLTISGAFILMLLKIQSANPNQKEHSA